MYSSNLGTMSAIEKNHLLHLNGNTKWFLPDLAGKSGHEEDLSKSVEGEDTKLGWMNNFDLLGFFQSYAVSHSICG